MDRRLFFLIFLLLVALFFYSSKSIVGVKVQELRFYLAKEQLLNYELSSKVLREKIRQMLLNRDDYTNEIKNNILESNIMNSQTGLSQPDLSFSDSFGLLLVNGVRFVSLKSPLKLVEDQNDMIQIQFAFYMERTRKFSIAAKKYSELSEKFGKAETNENGFVMLHHGFCLAMMGETEAAIVKLKATEQVFSGTHFAENARILINALLEGVRKKEIIASNSGNSEEKANLLYENGNYKETLAELNKIENRNTDQNYMRARSFEELGQTSNAVSEYIKLVEQKNDNEIAKKANRRLLLIGNIYEKNEEISNYSKKQAEKLGDQEVVKQVESGSNLIAKSVVIEKLTSENKGTEDAGIDQAELEELKKEFETIKIEEEKERKETVVNLPPVVKEEPKEEPKEEYEEINLLFTLVDGRVLKGDRADGVDGKLNLHSSIFNITIPPEVVSEITLDRKPKNVNKRIWIVMKNGKKYSGTKVVGSAEFFTIYHDSGTSDKVDSDETKEIYIR